ITGLLRAHPDTTHASTTAIILVSLLVVVTAPTIDTSSGESNYFISTVSPSSTALTIRATMPLGGATRAFTFPPPLPLLPSPVSPCGDVLGACEMSLLVLSLPLSLFSSIGLYPSSGRAGPILLLGG